MYDHGIGNANWLEIIWLLTGGIGAAVYWLLVVRSAGDRRLVIKAKGDRVRVLVADMTYWTDVVLFTVLGGFATIGLLACATPDDSWIAGLIVTIILFYASGAITCIGVMRRRWREKIMHIEDHHDAVDAEGWSGEERRQSQGAKDVLPS